MKGARRTKKANRPQGGGFADLMSVPSGPSASVGVITGVARTALSSETAPLSPTRNPLSPSRSPLSPSPSRTPQRPLSPPNPPQEDWHSLLTVQPKRRISPTKPIGAVSRLSSGSIQRSPSFASTSSNVQDSVLSPRMQQPHPEPPVPNSNEGNDPRIPTISLNVPAKASTQAEHNYKHDSTSAMSFPSNANVPRTGSAQASMNPPTSNASHSSNSTFASSAAAAPIREFASEELATPGPPVPEQETTNTNDARPVTGPPKVGGSMASSSTAAVPSFLSGWDGADGWGDDPVDSDPDEEHNNAWDEWDVSEVNLRTDEPKHVASNSIEQPEDAVLTTSEPTMAAVIETLEKPPLPSPEIAIESESTLNEKASPAVIDDSVSSDVVVATEAYIEQESAVDNQSVLTNPYSTCGEAIDGAFGEIEASSDPVDDGENIFGDGTYQGIDASSSLAHKEDSFMSTSEPAVAAVVDNLERPPLTSTEIVIESENALDEKVSPAVIDGSVSSDVAVASEACIEQESAVDKQSVLTNPYSTCGEAIDGAFGEIEASSDPVDDGENIFGDGTDQEIDASSSLAHKEDSFISTSEPAVAAVVDNLERPPLTSTEIVIESEKALDEKVSPAVIDDSVSSDVAVATEACIEQESAVDKQSVPTNPYSTCGEAIDETVGGRETSPDPVTNGDNIIDDGTHDEIAVPSYSFPVAKKATDLDDFVTNDSFAVNAWDEPSWFDKEGGGHDDEWASLEQKVENDNSSAQLSVDPAYSGGDQSIPVAMVATTSTVTTAPAVSSSVVHPPPQGESAAMPTEKADPEGSAREAKANAVVADLGIYESNANTEPDALQTKAPEQSQVPIGQALDLSGEVLQSEFSITPSEVSMKQHAVEQKSSDCAEKMEALDNGEHSHSIVGGAAQQHSTDWAAPGERDIPATVEHSIGTLDVGENMEKKSDYDPFAVVNNSKERDVSTATAQNANEAQSWFYDDTDGWGIEQGNDNRADDVQFDVVPVDPKAELNIPEAKSVSEDCSPLLSRKLEKTGILTSNLENRGSLQTSTKPVIPEFAGIQSDGKDVSNSGQKLEQDTSWFEAGDGPWTNRQPGAEVNSSQSMHSAPQEEVETTPTFAKHETDAISSAFGPLEGTGDTFFGPEADKKHIQVHPVSGAHESDGLRTDIDLQVFRSEIVASSSQTEHEKIEQQQFENADASQNSKAVIAPGGESFTVDNQKDSGPFNGPESDAANTAYDPFAVVETSKDLDSFAGGMAENDNMVHSWFDRDGDGWGAEQGGLELGDFNVHSGADDVGMSAPLPTPVPIVPLPVAQPPTEPFKPKIEAESSGYQGTEQDRTSNIVPSPLGIVHPVPVYIPQTSVGMMASKPGTVSAGFEDRVPARKEAMAGDISTAPIPFTQHSAQQPRGANVPIGFEAGGQDYDSRSSTSASGFAGTVPLPASQPPGQKMGSDIASASANFDTTTKHCDQDSMATSVATLPAAPSASMHPPEMVRGGLEANTFIERNDSQPVTSTTHNEMLGDGDIEHNYFNQQTYSDWASPQLAHPQFESLEPPNRRNAHEKLSVEAGSANNVDDRRSVHDEHDFNSAFANEDLSSESAKRATGPFPETPVPEDPYSIGEKKEHFLPGKSSDLYVPSSVPQPGQTLEKEDDSFVQTWESFPPSRGAVGHSMDWNNNEKGPDDSSMEKQQSVFSSMPLPHNEGIRTNMSTDHERVVPETRTTVPEFPEQGIDIVSSESGIGSGQGLQGGDPQFVEQSSLHAAVANIPYPRDSQQDVQLPPQGLPHVSGAARSIPKTFAQHPPAAQYPQNNSSLQPLPIPPPPAPVRSLIHPHTQKISEISAHGSALPLASEAPTASSLVPPLTAHPTSQPPMPVLMMPQNGGWPSATAGHSPGGSSHTSLRVPSTDIPSSYPIPNSLIPSSKELSGLGGCEESTSQRTQQSDYLSAYDPVSHLPPPPVSQSDSSFYIPTSTSIPKLQTDVAPPPVPSMDSTFAYPFSIMDSGISGDAEYRPPRPVMSWGFGGSLVVALPPSSSNSFEIAAPSQQSTNSSSPTVNIFDMQSIASEVANDDLIAACEAVAPLSFPTNPSGLSIYAEMCDRMSKSSPGYSSSLSEGRSALWRLLAHMCRQSTGDWRASVSAAISGPSSVPMFGHGLSSVSNVSTHESPLRMCSAPSAESESKKSRAAAEVERLISQGKGLDAVRVAQSAGLWSVALVLASALDRAMYMNIVTEFTRSELVGNSALQTMCLTVAENDTEIARNATSPAGLEDWKKTVGILLASRHTSAQARDRLGGRYLKLIGEIGDAILTCKNDIVAAHVCFILSGRIQSLGMSTVPLLGGDFTVPAGRPRSSSSAAVVLQSLVLEALCNVSGGTPFNHLLPFRLILAGEIAAMGRSDVALAHCTAAIASIRSEFESNHGNVANTFTAPFLSCLEGLEQRLRGHLDVREQKKKEGTLSALGRSLTSVFNRGQTKTPKADTGSSDHGPSSSQAVPSKTQGTSNTQLQGPPIHLAPHSVPPLSGGFPVSSPPQSKLPPLSHGISVSQPAIPPPSHGVPVSSSPQRTLAPYSHGIPQMASSQPAPQSFIHAAPPPSSSLPIPQSYGGGMPPSSVTNPLPTGAHPPTVSQAIGVGQGNGRWNDVQSGSVQPLPPNVMVDGNARKGFDADRWGSIVSKTVSMLAPAGGDLSPPPRTRSEGNFPAMEAAPLGLNTSTGSRAPGYDMNSGGLRPSASAGNFPDVSGMYGEHAAQGQSDGDFNSMQAHVAQGHGGGGFNSMIQRTASADPMPRESMNNPSYMQQSLSTPEQDGGGGYGGMSQPSTIDPTKASDKKPPRAPKNSTSDVSDGSKLEKGGSVKGWRSRITERLMSAFGTAKKAHMGKENAFVFDKDRGRWVIPGEDPNDDDAPPPPPPVDDELMGSGDAQAQTVGGTLLSSSVSYGDGIPTQSNGSHMQRSHSIEGDVAGGLDRNPMGMGYGQMYSSTASFSTTPDKMGNVADSESATSMTSGQSGPMGYSSGQQMQHENAPPMTSLAPVHTAPTAHVATVPPQTNSAGNKFRAGTGRLAGRRAYVDTFNKGGSGGGGRGAVAPLRAGGSLNVPAPGLGSSGQRGGYQIFTPGVMPGAATNSNAVDGGPDSAQPNYNISQTNMNGSNASYGYSGNNPGGGMGGSKG